MRIPLHAHDRQLGFSLLGKPALGIDHDGVFPNGHAVHHGYFMHAHKRSECGLKHRSVHIVSIRIGSVQYDERDPGLGAGIHGQTHGGDVGIESRAHILKIEEHQLDILQLIGCGAAVLAIQANDREARTNILAIGDLGTCGLLSPKTVFRSKDLLHIHPFFEQEIDQMYRIHQRTLMRDHADLLALQQILVGLPAGSAREQLLRLHSLKVQRQKQAKHELDDTFGATH